MKSPFTYNQLNLYESTVSPSSVHCNNTELVHYFYRYLIQKVMSVYKWTLPKEWDTDYFYYTLYEAGFIAIINTDDYGVIPQQCTLGGLNIFYRPKWLLVANPLLPTLSGKTQQIGIDATLIKMQPNYLPITDKVLFYADMLALCAEAYGVNILNSKLAYCFSAKNKNAAESFKKGFDKIASGEPMVVFDKALYNEDGTSAWDSFAQNLKQNYIASDLLADMQTIKDQFNTEIGIPNANLQKRERMIVDEVNANNSETNSLCELWLETMQRGCKEANEMFGIDINVELKNPVKVSNMALGGNLDA